MATTAADAPTGDRPITVSIDGQSVGAIPPNVRNDIRWIKGRMPDGTWAEGWDGFATTWTYTTLQPGSIAFARPQFRNGQMVHEQNLVFQVPLDSQSNMHPLGVALIDTSDNHVIAYQLLSNWGEQADPASF